MMQKNWHKTALGRFRTIAIAEGISFLILLLIAMPLKYLAGFPQAVMVTGWIHGLLFVSYMIAGLDVRSTHQWGFKKVATAVAAAFIPFGPFILDKRILQNEVA